MSTKAGDGGGITLMKWTGGSDQNYWAMAAVSLRPASASARTSTPALTATPTSQDEHWGTGADGDLVVGTTATITAVPTAFNLNTKSLNQSRTCGDAFASSVVQLPDS